jgi:hypothetical protein
MTATRCTMKPSSIGIAFSHQRVLSLSKTATRSSCGISRAAVSTNSTIVCVVPVSFHDVNASTIPYWPAVSAASSFSTAWSIVKLAARWRGGNSLNVSRNWLTTTLAASTR